MDNIGLITRFLRDNFDHLTPTNIISTRTYTHDVYKVIAGREYALKVYGENWRTEEELLFEVDLLNFLKNNDVGVAGPVKGKNEKYVYTLGKNNQFAILFEWADGNKPTSPFNSADRELLGKATAKIHLATDSFKSSHHRPELDINYLITWKFIRSVTEIPKDWPGIVMINCGPPNTGHQLTTKLTELWLGRITVGQQSPESKPGRVWLHRLQKAVLTPGPLLEPLYTTMHCILQVFEAKHFINLKFEI